MTIILADLGGTNLRLAHAETPSEIATFRIKDFPSFESVLETYAPGVSVLYLASAITPLKGVIEDTRFSTQSHWKIDLNSLAKNMRVTVLNDLEAAAYGLPRIDAASLPFLLKPTTAQTQFSYPPKILVSIGTGIGHAFIFEKPGWPPLVQRTHGGWIMPFGISEEQQIAMQRMREHIPADRDLIMEDFVSGHGLWAMQEMFGKKDAGRLFWEFLGLYCNTLTTTSGAYGGICLSGGIIDDMAAENAFDTKSFQKYFIRRLAASVVESLSATPVYYCHDVNLPVIGLSEYRRAQG